MKILFTGASSFTGYWFVKELKSAGHDIAAVFRRQPAEYTEYPRRQRVEQLGPSCRCCFGTSFGDDRFLELICEGGWDLLCHHGADVTDYRSADFDVTRATANNTYRLGRVLDELAKIGCSKVVVTGSVFENDEGAGSQYLRAFSPYGLSKSFSWQLFRFHCERREVSLGKFVIPNPFGPYEEPRFIHYLIKNWFAGQIADVHTPDYVRDNIHVSLLARAYARFSTSLPAGISRTNPSGYVESQGSFAARVASEMRPRLGVKCELRLAQQSHFPEPYCRINTDRCDPAEFNWTEAHSWDDLAGYYARVMGSAH